MTDETEVKTPKPVLNERQLSFVTVLHQHWMTDGELLTAAACRKLYGVSETEFVEYMSTAKVKAALTERGVTLEKFDLGGEGEWKSKVLTPQQLAVANCMLDLTDTRSNKKKLQDMGIATATYAAWLRDPVYRDYLQTRAENLLGDNSHEVLLALSDKANSGDTKAIELYLELTGRFTRASARNQSGASQLDVQGLLISIIEIIADEVDDPNVAARIADRLKSLGEARTLANGLMGEANVIVQPEIAKARELSPAMKALQDSGAGVNG